MDQIKMRLFIEDVRPQRKRGQDKIKLVMECELTREAWAQFGDALGKYVDATLDVVPEVLDEDGNVIDPFQQSFPFDENEEADEGGADLDAYADK